MAYKGQETYYEWGAEHNDDDENINDCDFFDKLADAVAFIAGVPGWEIVLVRNVGSDSEGVEDRQWAYPDADGNLPEHFDGGAKVPQRFHKEWEAAR